MITEPLSQTRPPQPVLPVEETTPGNYFISNYPPVFVLDRERVADAYSALDRPPRAGTPLGVYLHIPFCRKRCHFCYFKVYTDKKADEIEGYLDAALQELELYSEKAFIGGQKASVHLFRRRNTLLYFVEAN